MLSELTVVNPCKPIETGMHKPSGQFPRLLGLHELALRRGVGSKSTKKRESWNADSGVVQ